MSQKANVSSAGLPTVLNPGWEAITPGVIQNVSYSTHAESAAFNANTTIVRIVANSDCWVLFGSTPVATTSNSSFMPSGVIEYFGVTGGQKVSVVQDSASGKLNITEGLSPAGFSS